MLAQLTQDIVTLLRLARWNSVVTDRNDARYDLDDLRQVFVQRR